jgi:hypothetical protein
MWLQNPIGIILAASVTEAGNHEVPQLDGVMLLGFLSAFFTMAFYINRHQSRSMMVALALSLAATAMYGFLQGAWPLGFIQAVWSVMTLRQSFKPRTNRKSTPRRRWQYANATPRPYEMESRISRMFGSN